MPSCSPVIPSKPCHRHGSFALQGDWHTDTSIGARCLELAERASSTFAKSGATEAHGSKCCPALQDIWSDLQLFLTFNTVLLVLGAFIKTAVVDRLDLHFGGPQALDSDTATG